MVKKNKFNVFKKKIFYVFKKNIYLRIWKKKWWKQNFHPYIIFYFFSIINIFYLTVLRA